MPKIKTCLICATVFEVKPVYYARSKYCSLACSGVARRRQVERRCRNCGEAFMFAPSQMQAYPNAGKYCSRKCGYAYRVAKNADRPSTDAYDRTRRVADVEWQKAVREKDDFTCQRCGIRQPYIHTHHKATRGSRPDLKHVVSNGICLCNSCHAWVHHHPDISYENGWLIKSGSN